MQYVVQNGDTLSAISQKFYGSPSYYRAIVAANPIIQNENLIQIGWMLEIPGSELLGPIRPGDPTMRPPGVSSGFTPSPSPSPQPLPSPYGPGTVLQPTPAQESKTKLYLLIAAALVGGFFIVQYLSKQQAAPKEKPTEPQAEAV